MLGWLLGTFEDTALGALLGIALGRSDALGLAEGKNVGTSV